MYAYDLSPRELYDAVFPVFEDFWIDGLVSVITGNTSLPLPQKSVHIDLLGTPCNNRSFGSIAKNFEGAYAKFPFFFGANRDKSGAIRYKCVACQGSSSSVTL